MLKHNTSLNIKSLDVNHRLNTSTSILRLTDMICICFIPFHCLLVISCGFAIVSSATTVSSLKPERVVKIIRFLFPPPEIAIIDCVVSGTQLSI